MIANVVDMGYRLKRLENAIKRLEASNAIPDCAKELILILAEEVRCNIRSEISDEFAATR